MDDSGNFTLLYREQGTNIFSASGAGIWARGFNWADGSSRYSGAHTVAGSWLAVDIGTGNDASSATLAMASDGAFVVTYQKTGANGLDILARRYKRRRQRQRRRVHRQTRPPAATRKPPPLRCSTPTTSWWPGAAPPPATARASRRAAICSPSTPRPTWWTAAPAPSMPCWPTPGADGRISLREALEAANASAGLNTIRFNLPGAGAQTIALTAALPVIADAVVIDGSSDPDFEAQGQRPVVIIDGQDLPVDGLTLADAADGSTLQGLVIRNFGGNGITLMQNADHKPHRGEHHRQRRPPGRRGRQHTGQMAPWASSCKGPTTPSAAPRPARAT